jgi:manganese/iron transport system permease protein
MIAPGAIAYLLVRRFSSMMLVATLITWAAMMGGVYASFWLNSAPAPTIILLLSAMFLLAFSRKTLLARRAVSV